MTNPEWTPGDVGSIDSRGPDALVVRLLDGTWHAARSGSDLNPHLEPRPLVVIDPEDREQVERLLSYYVAPFDDFVTDGRLDHMQAALREFADPHPPKPEEPTGLGAVVEDADGERWVRFRASTGWWWRDLLGKNSRWDDLAAVRVLSEGVAS